MRSTPKKRVRIWKYWCFDCGAAKPAPYMVHHALWAYAFGVSRSPERPQPALKAGILCLPCLSKRLGRPITEADLIPGLPINNLNHPINRPLVEALEALKKGE